MRTQLASRSAALPMVVVLLVVGVGCGGGGGKAGATPSSTAPPTLAAAGTPATMSAVTPTREPDATPRPAATIELSAAPQQLTCDGVQVSTVTARVLDNAGMPVANGTTVHFSVQVLGSADPVVAQTLAGVSQTSVTARGERVGVVVNVTSGDAAASIRIDCL